MAGKSNPMGKMRPSDKPYMTIVANGWMWKVRKGYVANPDQPFARVFAEVTSPFTMGGSDMGDTYWVDIRGKVTQLDRSVPLSAIPEHLKASAREYISFWEEER